MTKDSIEDHLAAAAAARRSSPTIKRQIDRLARQLHRCPEGYEGPCWGPTAEDRAAAWQQIKRESER